MHIISSVMGSIASLVVAPIVKQIKYVFKVGSNMRDLRKDVDNLELTKNEVQGKITRATEARDDEVPTERVQKWLNEVQMAVDEVTKTEEEHKRLRMCFGSCPLNCWSGYKTSKRAAEVTTQVKVLLDEGNKMDGVTNIVVPPLRPISDSSLSLPTSEIFLREAIECMKDETVDMIGIWGMGGVGKTTLMKRINNHPYVNSAGYDVVIWAVVSQEVSFERLQRDIGKRVGLKFTEEQSISEESQAETLRHYLKGKIFLLLLDDIWKAFDLDILGIPSLDSSHNSKVIFTTRSEAVCDQMVAFRRQAKFKKIKAECLKPQEAWELFLANTGETVQSIIKSDGRVRERAQTVASKCAGLSLALVVIARAMSSNKTWYEWEDAVHSINDLLRLQELWGKETDPLYPVLRISYDRLMDDQMRKCFLCCALWPEDFNIPKEDLIRCWLGMGLIADFRNILDAFIKGHTIIERLKGAAMLEETEIDLRSPDESCVKLHDIMRGMALWIASDHEKWIVQTQAEINTATTPEEERSRKWREAEVVSLMFGKVKGLSSQFPHCPNIKALLLRETEIIGDVDAHAFLQNIPVLQYLDLLGGYRRYVFDKNKLLCDMSHQLVGLQCLDLSHVFGLVLPKELVKLLKLKHLFIRHGEILSIPRGLISGLEKLEILDLSYTRYLKWETPGEARIEELGCANAAGGLKGIGLRLLHDHFKILPTYIDRHLPLFELEIDGDFDTLPTLELSKAVFPGGIFPFTLRSLQFSYFSVDAAVISAEENDRLDNLEVLSFYSIKFRRHGRFGWEGGATPQVLFQNVSSLTFFLCSGLQDLGWIAQLPYLEILTILFCHDLEQVIPGKKAAREVEEDETAEGEQIHDNRAMILPKLRFLSLIGLPKLRSFCEPTVTLPSLQRVHISVCPNLDLSFNKTEAAISI